VPKRGAGLRPIGRLDHPPFRTPSAEEAAFAVSAAALLAAPAERAAAASGAALGRRNVPDPGAARRTLEAAALAVSLEAPLVVATTDPFRDLVRVSAWSMNAPGRPPDGVLARHLSIAERGAAEFRPLAAAALDALLAGDESSMAACLRARRAPRRPMDLRVSGSWRRRAPACGRCSSMSTSCLPSPPRGSGPPAG